MHPTLPMASLSLAACLALAACSSGDGAKDPTTPSATTSSTTPSPSDLPVGVTLTAPGTELSFGDTASVVYSPTQDLETVLALTVKSARKGRLSDLNGFDLTDDYRKNASYYYVRVTVENLGTGDVGAHDIPLDGVNGENILLPPVVLKSQFDKCPFERLPSLFAQGTTFDTCLVYLSPDHGELSAVSYRPDDFVLPVLWTGEVKAPVPVKETKRGKKHKG